MAKKQNKADPSENTMYHVVCIMQRVSLLAAATATGILWASLISIAHNLSFASSQGTRIVNFDNFDLAVTNELRLLTMYAVILSVAAGLLTLILLKFPRVQKYEKKMVADGLVIAGFLLVIAVYCQPIYATILGYVAQ